MEGRFSATQNFFKIGERCGGTTCEDYVGNFVVGLLLLGLLLLLLLLLLH